MEYAWHGSLAAALERPGNHCSALEGLDPLCTVTLNVQIGPCAAHMILCQGDALAAFRFVDHLSSLECDRIVECARSLSCLKGVSGYRPYGAVILNGYAGEPYVYDMVMVLPAKGVSKYMYALRPKGEGLSDWLNSQVSEEKVAAWKARSQARLAAWRDAVLEGWFSDAKQLAADVYSSSHRMYVTQDYQLALAYLADKGAWKDCRSDGVKSLGKYPSQHTGEDYALVLWGDDLKWIGRWKKAPFAPNDCKDRYARMLCQGERGMVVFVPPLSEMTGTFRALMDAGLFQLK